MLQVSKLRISKALRGGVVTAASSVVLFGAGAGVAYSAGELNVTNWAEYIAEDTISNFAEEYDVKVTYDSYDSVEAIDSKLLAGDTGYDVVSHSGSSIARLIPAGILQPVDKSRLPNFKHIRGDVMSLLDADWDPDNQYIVPYMFGTHGVTYNEALVLETYPQAPLGSLDLIFDPVHIAKLAECGVSFLDSPNDVIPMALAYIGKDPNSTNLADYKEVEKMLLKIRPYVKTFDNYAYQRMPEKEFCVAVTFGPDGLLAVSLAVEANTGVELDFFLPQGKNAANFWIDGWVIPADAENLENAHLFLNYMMRPQVAANDSGFTWYATANETAFALVDEEITSSPAAYPHEKDVANMYTLAVVPPKVERARTRAWTNFKAGN